jgi:hypothetical protein
MKHHNPHTPIMVREALNTQPRVFARYEFGREKVEELGGEFMNFLFLSGWREERLERLGQGGLLRLQVESWKAEAGCLGWKGEKGWEHARYEGKRV